VSLIWMYEQQQPAPAIHPRLILNQEQSTRDFPLSAMPPMSSDTRTARPDPIDADVDEADSIESSMPEAKQPVDSGGNSQDSPPESLGKRFLQPRTLISFALAGFIVFFVFRRLEINIDEVWREMKDANPALLLAALLTYYLAILIRALRWRMMLEQVGINEKQGYQLPGVLGTFQIMLLSLFANCVVPARLGDAYRSFLLKDRTGSSFGVGLGTILAERLIDLVVMIGLVVSAGAVVFGTNVPGKAEQAFLLGLAVVLIGIVGSIVLYFHHERIEKKIPDQFSGHFRRLNQGIFDILRRPLSFAALGVVVWLMDGLRVYLVAEALGANLTIPEAVVVSLLSAMVTIIPITPAGLGVVEGFMIWILVQVGVDQDTAAAIAILDRTITYLSLIVVGLPMYVIHLRRTVIVKPDDVRPAPSGG
jgi:glycosyltransferase 2 family protein